MSSVVLWFYARLMWVAQPLLRRKLARRGRLEPGYAEAVDERFGTYTQPAEHTSERVWVHAVSLGETRTAAVLIGALRAQYPGLRLLLTHGTPPAARRAPACCSPATCKSGKPGTARTPWRVFLITSSRAWAC